MDYNEKSINKIVKDYDAKASSIILMLQDVQSEFKYIPKEAVKKLSNDLDIPEAQIYHITTFYSAFSLIPKGEHEIRVCLGTACHIKGGKRIAEGFERALDVKAGDTTEDKKFTLETVNCLGACALAPLVQVDDENHSKMTIEKVDKVLKKY